MASSAPRARTQVVGNAFVTQYYQILHQHPEQVHKFYQDLSFVSRPGSDGVTTSVTTIQAINDKILSWDYSNCFTKIETVDSSSTYNEGVLVLVTGLFTASDIKRKFAQTFFLAPQDNGGFFVLNDIFSLLEEAESVEKNNIHVNSTDYDEPNVPLPAELEPISQENHITEEVLLSEVDVVANDKVIDTIENVSSGVEGETAGSRPENASQNHVQPVHETVASTAQNDEPKKSYASILKVTNGSTTSKNLIYVPTTVKAKVTLPTNKPVVPTDKAVAPVDKPVVKASTAAEIIPNGTVVPEKNNPHEEEGYSVYIRNLPVDARPEEVEQEFKKFGTIKPGGVQVRNHKIDNFCFGFVEFDSAESMQAATKASPIEIRGYTAHIEQKRTATRVVNGVVTYNANSTGGRGHYQQGGRNGFRNDNFRGRGNFGANVGYRRNDFRSRVDYNGRGRDYQQRLYQNGDGNGNGHGRVGHRLNGGSKEIAAVA